MQESAPVGEAPPTADSLAERLEENGAALDDLRERLATEETPAEESAPPPPGVATVAPESREERRRILSGRPTPEERGLEIPPATRRLLDPRSRRLGILGSPPASIRVPSFEPEVSDAMRQTPITGGVMGILVGSARFGREFLQGLVEIVSLFQQLDQSLRSGRARRWLDEVLAMDREAWMEIVYLVAEWSRDPRPLAEAVWSPVFSVMDHFQRGLDLAAEDQVESSAEIWQGTLETIDLLDTLAGIPELVEHAPALARRLSSMRRRLMETISSHADDFRHLAGRDAVAVPPPLGRRRPAPRPASPEMLLRRGEGYRIRAREALVSRRRSWRTRVRFNRTPDLRSEFRDWVRDRVTATPGHPLLTLIDEETGGIFRPSGREMEELLSAPYMDAGHVTSRHSGDAERFALEWSYLNQEASVGEGAGEVLVREVVDINGVPVELRTARMLEDEGFLPAGTVDAASASHGWSMDDWRIQMTQDAEVYRWIPRAD